MNMTVSNRVDQGTRGAPMDLTPFLTLAVALLIIVSGYLLFNDVPTLGKNGTRRRR